jgi:hypothetical protein
VAQLYPGALGSLYVTSYDSQGYSGGILILPQSGGPGPLSPRNRVVQLKVKVKRQSHVTTDGQSISMSWYRVHKALEGYIKAKCLMLPFGGLHMKHAW